MIAHVTALLDAAREKNSPLVKDLLLDCIYNKGAIGFIDVFKNIVISNPESAKFIALHLVVEGDGCSAGSALRVVIP